TPARTATSFTPSCTPGSPPSSWTWYCGACRSASTSRRGSISRAPSTRCSRSACSTSWMVRCSRPSTRSTSSCGTRTALPSGWARTAAMRTSSPRPTAPSASTTRRCRGTPWPRTTAWTACRRSRSTAATWRLATPSRKYSRTPTHWSPRRAPSTRRHPSRQPRRASRPSAFRALKFEELAPLGHALAACEVDADHRAGVGRGDGVLHFHGFDHHERIAGGDLLADAHRHGHDHAGERRGESAARRARRELLGARVIEPQLVLLSADPQHQVLAVAVAARLEAPRGEPGGHALALEGRLRHLERR